MKKLTLLLAYALSAPLHANIDQDKIEQANIEQAKVAFEIGKFPLARSILLQQNDNNYQKHHYLAQIASKNDRLEDAEKYIEKAIKLNGKDAYVQFTYGEIMAQLAEEASIFNLKGYINKVKKAFTAAAELDPENIKHRRALINFHINAPSILGGDIEVALKHAQELKIALLNFVDEPELHYQLGIYYQEQERFNEALIYFRKAVNMATSTEKQRNAKYSAAFQLGRTSQLNNSNFDEAEKALTLYLNEAVISSSMPSKDWVKFRLANILEAQEKKSEAMKLYEDLFQESSDKALRKQAKKRIRKLS